MFATNKNKKFDCYNLMVLKNSLLQGVDMDLRRSAVTRWILIGVCQIFLAGGAEAAAMTLSGKPATEAGGAGLPTSDEMLLDKVHSWAEDWESGDPERYFSRYAKRFAPASGESREKWMASRRERLRSNTQISVEIEDFKVLSNDGNVATVTFLQQFSSLKVQDSSQKTLQMVIEDGEWKIIAEVATAPGKPAVLPNQNPVGNFSLKAAAPPPAAKEGTPVPDITLAAAVEAASSARGKVESVATGEIPPAGSGVSGVAAARPAPVVGSEEDCYGGAGWRSAPTDQEPTPEAAKIRALKPRESFRDCEDCPEMLVVPKGSFGIGSLAKDNPDESPVRRVELSPFAVGKYEVTWREFEKFVVASGRMPADGCRTWNEGGGKWDIFSGIDWAQPGYIQTPTHPAVCIGWDDAKAYVEWLSKRTGKRYRLPSETEWEYAARGSSIDPTPWGRYEKEACKHANVADSTPKGEFGWPKKVDCSDGSWGVSRVGVYQANGFGMHDTIGNVWEWVEDCATADYKQLAVDGRPYTCGQCEWRMIRGGAWSSRPDQARFGKRGRALAERRSVTIGFRVARDLE